MIIEINGVELRQFRDTHFYLNQNGEVYSLASRRYIRPYNTGEYLCFKTPQGKNIKVHKAVAECWIANSDPSELCLVDHIDRNKMDNSVANLRWVSTSQNNHNKTKQRGSSSSRYKGVSWDNTKRRWMATITVGGQRIKIGSYHCEHEAGRAYNDMAEAILGDYAVLNEIQEDSN